MWLFSFNINSDGDFPVFDLEWGKNCFGENFESCFVGVYETKEDILCIVRKMFDGMLVTLRSGKERVNKEYLLETIDEFIEITENLNNFISEIPDFEYLSESFSLGNQTYCIGINEIHIGSDFSNIVFDTLYA